VGAEISGRISQVEADFNQRVTQGQVLARFDRDGLQAQLAQARAAAAAAEMALAQAQTDQQQLARTLGRVERLHGQSAVSEADLESSQASARLAAQRVEAAQAQLRAQRANLALAETNLDHSVIRAPIDGIVITRNIDPGQTVAAMLQSPTLFTVAADLRKVRVIAAIDEADIGEVTVGQRATFTVTAYPDRVFEGAVVEVRNSPVITQDVVTYGAVIEADNLDLALKPGMTASVRVRTGYIASTLRVPSAALRFRPPQRLEQQVGPATPGEAVWLVDGERLRRVALKTGISDGELTAVTTDELTPATRLVVDLTAAGRALYEANNK
jgi:HlyD family secretion protein